jgi:CRP-like cAMP-binding protein
MADNKVYEPLLDVENVLGILSKISIFAGLNDKQLYRLFRLLEEVSYRKDEIIFRQGDVPSYIYIIKSGRVKRFKEEDHTTLELIVIGPGQSFGVSSIIGIQHHGSSAIAVENTELIVLSRKMLMSIYESDMELFSTLIFNIAREVCRRLHSSEDILLHYLATNKPNVS